MPAFLAPIFEWLLMFLIHRGTDFITSLVKGVIHDQQEAAKIRREEGSASEGLKKAQTESEIENAAKDAFSGL